MAVAKARAKETEFGHQANINARLTAPGQAANRQAGNIGSITRARDARGRLIKGGTASFSSAAGGGSPIERLLEAGRTGMINGLGDYGFMLTATDESLTPSTDVDLFRMKIWDKGNGDGSGREVGRGTQSSI